MRLGDVERAAGAAGLVEHQELVRGAAVEGVVELRGADHQRRGDRQCGDHGEVALVGGDRPGPGRTRPVEQFGVGGAGACQSRLAVDTDAAPERRLTNVLAQRTARRLIEQEDLLFLAPEGDIS
jgi:hypothetical protein